MVSFDQAGLEINQRIYFILVFWLRRNPSLKGRLIGTIVILQMRFHIVMYFNYQIKFAAMN